MAVQQLLFITIELLKKTLDENKELGAQLIHNNDKNETPGMLFCYCNCTYTFLPAIKHRFTFAAIYLSCYLK